MDTNETFIVTRLNDKPFNTVTTFVQSVHPSPAHNHEDGHATRQLHCQWWSGQCLAKHAPNAARFRQLCTHMNTLAAGWCSISSSQMEWGRDCLAATDPVEWKQVLLAREVAQCRVPDVQERCLVERWRTRLTRQHHWQQLLLQKQVMLVGAIHFCSWINEDQVCNAQLWHADRNHDRLTERCLCAQQMLSSNLLLFHKVV